MTEAGVIGTLTGVVRGNATGIATALSTTTVREIGEREVEVQSGSHEENESESETHTDRNWPAGYTAYCRSGNRRIILGGTSMTDAVQPAFFCSPGSSDLGVSAETVDLRGG